MTTVWTLLVSVIMVGGPAGPAASEPGFTRPAVVIQSNGSNRSRSDFQSPPVAPADLFCGLFCNIKIDFPE